MLELLQEHQHWARAILWRYFCLILPRLCHGSMRSLVVRCVLYCTLNMMQGHKHMISGLIWISSKITDFKLQLSVHQQSSLWCQEAQKLLWLTDSEFHLKQILKKFVFLMKRGRKPLEVCNNVWMTCSRPLFLLPLHQDTYNKSF